jgi:hypothetical protein
MKKKLALVVALLALGGAAWAAKEEHTRLVRAAPYYAPYKDSLYRALKDNDFGYAFASPDDLPVLKEKFGWLAEHETQRAKVVALVKWIDENMAGKEIMSVRATALLEAGSGACEIHPFAIGVLRAFDIRARWIGTVKSSIGFGFLEAHVDGEWEVFRIRSGKDDPGLGKSAWALYEESEPSLSIRNFWFKPKQSTSSWKGTVYPAIFPFANVEEHPELEALFTTDRGLDVDYEDVNPYAYVYGYFQKADKEWIEQESVMANFRRHNARWGMKKTRWRASAIDKLGLTSPPAP